MSALLHVINQFAQAISPIFYKLVYLSLTALPVGAAIALVRKIWDKRISPQWKYLMWMVLLLALMVPWRPQSPVCLTGSVQQVEDVSYREAYSTAHLEVAQDAQNPQLAPQQLEQNQQQERLLLWKSVLFDVALPLIWFVGMLIWLGILLRTQRTFSRKIRAATVEQSAFSPMAAQCRRQLGIRQAIPVVVQNYVTSPALAGILHPRILLPACAHQMAPDTLRFVLLHELGHYKRRDLWLNQLLLILQCVYWFNPLIGLFAKPIRQDMELMNDSWLLKKLGSEQRAPYSRSLVEVLGLTRRVTLSSRMVMMSDGGKNTERRINMMRSHGFFRKHRLAIGLCSLALIAALCSLFLTSKPAQLSPEQAADALVDSIQNTDGMIQFTIPQDGPAAEDWTILISGRAVFSDGMSMSLHFLDGETWQPGKQYEFNAAESTPSELSLYLALPGDVERDVDLMPYLNSASSAESVDIPVAGLTNYTTFIADNPDLEPGNLALTGQLSQEDMDVIVNLLSSAQWEAVPGPEYCTAPILNLVDSDGHMLQLDHTDANDTQHLFATRRDNLKEPLQTWMVTTDVSALDRIGTAVVLRAMGKPVPAAQQSGPTAELAAVPSFKDYFWEGLEPELKKRGFAYRVEYAENDRRWWPGIVLDIRLESGEPVQEEQMLSPDQKLVVSVAGPQNNAGTLGADELAEPTFLTKEQQSVYDRACDTSGWTIGCQQNLLSTRGNSFGEEVLVHDDRFVLVEGHDRDYEKFHQEMLEIFTPQALEDLHFDTRFANYNGQLAVRNSDYGGSIYASYQPDTYIPISQTADRVEFELVEHSIEPHTGETDDEFIARRARKDFDWSTRSSVQLVNTPNGWRVDRFAG